MPVRKLRLLFGALAIVLAFSGLRPVLATTTSSFTWIPYTHRSPVLNGADIITRTGNAWVASGGTLSFSMTGIGSYIADFIESQETFAVEGVRIEFDLQARVGTTLGYVGPYVLLVPEAGKGWNYGAPIGAQAFYRWEYGGTAGAVGRRGRIGNQDLGRTSFAGFNDGATARHVITVSGGVFTWSVNGVPVSSGDMGTAPYPKMRLIVGARLYDAGVPQSITIRNLTVTTATPAYSGPGNLSVTGTIADSSGRPVAADCSGNVQHRTNTASGAVTVSVTGAVGCTGGTGAYVNFSGTYDPATRTFSGTSTDAAGGSAQPIQFTVSGDLRWQGRFTGSAATAAGARAYDLTVALTLPEEAYNASADLTDMRLSGPISDTRAITIPLAIPQLGINTNFPLNIVVAGTWEVQLAPAAGGGFAMTGQASGTFRGDRPVAVTGTAVFGGHTIPVPISFSISGSFGGSMFGTSAGNSLRYAGSWTATDGDRSFGGDVNITLPIDLQSGRIQNMASAFSGAISPSIPNLPAMSVPVSFTGGNAVAVTPR